MKKFVVASVLAAVAASPAFAADFAGPRAEIHGGWDHVGAKYSYTDTAFPEDNVKVKQSANGFVGGVGIGYDFAVSESIRAGVLAAFDLSTAKKCDEVLGGDRLCFKARRDIEAGVRLGHVYGGKTLAYVGVSYVNGRGRFAYSVSNIAAFSASSTELLRIQDNRDGIRFTGGAEVALTPRAYAKLEYRYSDYKKFKDSFDTETESLGFDRHQVIAGIGYRF